MGMQMGYHKSSAIQDALTWFEQRDMFSMQMQSLNRPRNLEQNADDELALLLYDAAPQNTTTSGGEVGQAQPAANESPWHSFFDKSDIIGFGRRSTLERAFDLGPRHFSSVPTPVRYSSTEDQFSILLDRYDREFCTYPITTDVDINPFRYRKETSRGSKHLLHAIIALACHHRDGYPVQNSPSIEFYQHKNQAVALYRAAMENPQIQAQSLSALDTLLALWCIDSIESALNPWRTHLSHAYALLELSGGIDVWSLSFRSQTQVTMLLWWDAVVALVSRRPCVMPYTYFEAVLQWESSQFWTFFELIGCPRELLVPLMQFAHLAGQFNRWSRGMNVTKAVIAQVEGNLRNYQPPGEDEDVDSRDEEKVQEARDTYHCCEAIRHSLLIYALRVFSDDDRYMDSSYMTARLKYLSRVSLDHVCSISPSSGTLKQLLFVILVAGAETNDDDHKDFIRGYCRRWFETFGYPMFTSVIEILEEVWTGRDVVGEDIWWGDVVDSRHHGGIDGDLVFCFG
ncbi:uncharacterized protein Z518_07033 [Rhinocladiella mackenziei CBS 650.93]|uniref:Transcription factor domain-containing protein n=1 Tax=Rhinocladiella mackenziei CBS 650.93 TaxID=1442369 RepID=A0A0D2J3F7_9EURO|nr:uncharacterized protein Z518_07033 [Rhinocladiella mackenziei CBS 650.93]KIX03480.1 hypothetical protein Z518_07033 [Rhinocladiella mackenziei CBS 650.93]